MDFEQYRQAIVDEEQLRFLSVFYWVTGGFTALVSLYFLLYVALGFAVSFSDEADSIGWIFVGVGVVGFLLLGAFAALQVTTGFWLRKRTRRIPTMLVAAVSCLAMPFGTLLGVLTFLALDRPSVAALYGHQTGGPYYGGMPTPAYSTPPAYAPPPAPLPPDEQAS